jgi:hypothetical protein
MTSSLRRTPAIDGAEHAAVCKYCRRVHHFRRGVRSNIKHTINRRERQQAKRTIRAEIAS